ncbi:hypothetical protein FHR33_006788 [Nonomuraea dietziae]|uniref:Uncharacterized protein n=1 Tax=Nonomuraea dietziae TaxID=65515 RepID=A0A7W5YDV1_9ACTN|nr:hypothetical protein [Nonomuraea dietziae]
MISAMRWAMRGTIAAVAQRYAGRRPARDPR